MSDDLGRDSRLGKPSEVGDPLIDKIIFDQKFRINRTASAIINPLGSLRFPPLFLWVK